MRTKAVIHRDIDRVQRLCDLLVLNIATIRTKRQRMNAKSIAALTNKKVQQLKKAETHLKFLYDELDVVTSYRRTL